MNYHQRIDIDSHFCLFSLYDSITAPKHLAKMCLILRLCFHKHKDVKVNQVSRLHVETSLKTFSDNSIQIIPEMRKTISKDYLQVN